MSDHNELEQADIEAGFPRGWAGSVNLACTRWLISRGLHCPTGYAKEPTKKGRKRSRKKKETRAEKPDSGNLE